MGRRLLKGVSGDVPILEEDDGLGTSRSSSLAFSSNFQATATGGAAAATAAYMEGRQQQQQQLQPSASPTPQHEAALTHKTYSGRLLAAYRQKDETYATSEGRIEELHAHHRSHASWRFYRTMCQFRFGYLAFLVVMTILMFSFTLIMEIFFAIFLPSAKYDQYYAVRAVILLVTLPLILFFLSYLFEEAWRLFLDAINKSDGSMPNFRLALAVVIHFLRHRDELKDTDPVDEEPSADEGPRQDQAGTVENDTVMSPESRPSSPRRTSVHRRGTRHHRASLLLAAKDDPFLDDDKEEEDEKWERIEERRLEADEQEDAAPVVPSALANAEESTNTAAPSAPSRVASRWKRAKAAVAATMLMKKVEDEGPVIDLSTFIIVDIVCPVVFEVMTLASLIFKILTSWSVSGAFLAYVQMGFWVMSVYLILWMITHFWSSRNGKMRKLVSNYRRRRRSMLRALRHLERQKRSENLWLLDVGFRFYHHVGVAINPMGWFKRGKKNPKKNDEVDVQAVAIEVGENGGQEQTRASRHVLRMERIREVRAQVRAKNPWYSLSFRVRALILLLAVICSALLSLWSFMIGWPIMGMCMIALSSVIQQWFPQIFGKAFRHFITFFVMVSLVFFSSAIIIGVFTSTGSFQLGPYQNGTNDIVITQAQSDSLTLNGHAITFDATSQYPACSIDYGGLSVMDFALMADAAYGATTAEQKAVLTNRFNGTDLEDWEYVTRNNDSDYQVWMQLYFPSINMTVIAVRGTASVSDALEDMHFWFGITIMQAVNIFVPFLKQLPRKFVVWMLSMPLLSTVMPAPVYTDLLDHIITVRSQLGGANLVITGHSLGGAIAAMAGAKTKTRAVSFSGPGLLYSIGRFDIDAQDVRDYVLTMKPRKDIVPQVDQLGGMVQEIRCKHSSPMSCHSTTTHLCELYFSCGDVRGRNWNTTEVCIEYNALVDSDDDDDEDD